MTQRPARIALAVLLVLSHPVGAVTIVVDETTCTLVDAVTAANFDTATGGCPAGSGPDRIKLTTDVVLTTVESSYFGPNGLPLVSSLVTVNGQGFTIERDPTAVPFRLFMVRPAGVLKLENVELRGGETSSGGAGGAAFGRGTIHLINSTVTGNTAGNGGGLGIIHDPAFAPGVLTLTNSTVTGNSAVNGGGIWGQGKVTLTNSTVSGNSANLRGGGIGNRYVLGTGIGYVNLINSTVTGNTANEGGGIFSKIDGSDGNPEGDSIILLSSIVAGNPSGDNCGGGPITDEGNNFDDDGTCGAGFGTITGLDPDLADNGGPTRTHALLAGSSAIDAAGACGLDTDQRGFPRDDGACDSGAYEYSPCGNGSIDPGEECDDGNNIDGDGCAFDCTAEQDVPATTGLGLVLLVLALGGGATLALRRKNTT
jgi:cysteine-rich repeat protein